MDSSKSRSSQRSASHKPKRGRPARPAPGAASSPAAAPFPEGAKRAEGNGDPGSPLPSGSPPVATTRVEPIGEPSLWGALDLLPYQERWVNDSSPLKIVVKARQVGYSFAATLRAVLACLDNKTTWIFLSKGERQSRLLMEKVADHVRSFGVVARAMEATLFEGTLVRQLETRFPNGSVIYGLPANPDTARGYTGNVTLDEFAFHTDADKIYSALYPTITRGYSLEVVSTPNGTQGKFYKLAKAAGLEARDSGLRGEIGKWKSENGGYEQLSLFHFLFSFFLSPVTCHSSPHLPPRTSPAPTAWARTRP